MYHHIAIMYFKLLRETLRHLPRSPTERLQSGILENERNSSLVDSSGYRGSTVTGRNEAREREREGMRDELKYEEEEQSREHVTLA